MGLGQNFLTLVGSIFCCSGRVGSVQVSHLWFGFKFEKFALKCQIFQFFALQVKKNLFGPGQKVPGSEADWPLIYCGSKVSLDQGPSLVSIRSISFSEKMCFTTFGKNLFGKTHSAILEYFFGQVNVRPWVIVETKHFLSFIDQLSRLEK